MAYIKLCADNGIVFNPEKFNSSDNTVEFAGFDIFNFLFKEIILKFFNVIREIVP